MLSTIPVLNLADHGPDSLRQAIIDANKDSNADVITFAPGLHGTITLTSGELQITKNLDIEGPGANKLTISGSNNSRIFDIGPDATDVTIAGLTIADGLADKDAPVYASAGGGILNQGDLTLNNVVVSGNQAVGDASVTADVAGYVVTGAGYGGGVANFGTLKVAGSTFTANQALGGNDSVGPNVTTTGGLITFPGVGIGGGLYNAAGSSSATVTDSSFANNMAQGGSGCTGTDAGLGQAGAIYNAASLTITGSSFHGNQAVGGDHNDSDLYGGDAVGGGISSGNHTLLDPKNTGTASLSITGSSFRDNQAVGGDDNSGLSPPLTPSTGPGDGSGGGIFVFQGSATIVQTTLDSNQASGGAGGGDQGGSVGSGGGIAIVNFIDSVKANIKDSSIVHNEAIGDLGSSGGQGGGLNNEGGDVTISNSVLGHNQAVMGGAISNSGTLKIDHDVLSENQAVGDKNSSPLDSPGDALGGAVMTFGPLDVTACQFLNNQALGASGTPEQPLSAFAAGAAVGGAIYISDVAATPPDVNIDRSLFAGNVARGGDYCNGEGLAGLGEAGAIHNASILTVEHSTFRDNQAIGGDHNTGNRFIGLGVGGAISNGGSSASEVLLTVSGSNFDHNLALGGNYNTATSGRGVGANIGAGGAIQIGELVGADSHSITDSTFTHNQAIGGKGMAGENGGDGSGGALLVDAINSTVNVTVSHCTIDDNAAIGGPGGIGGNGGIGEGGGIANLATFIVGFDSALVVNDNTTVDHNQALGGEGGVGGNGGDGWGGGIASEGTSNAAITGGTALATLNVSNASVDHNKAQGGDGVGGGNGYGGGLYNGEESTFTLTDVTVQYNFAIGGDGSRGNDGDGVGGGVYNIGAFDSTLSSKYVIKKNQASTTSNDDIGP